VRTVVLGAGATGSLFGARLAAAGETVLLVGRREHVAAIRAHGLAIEGTAPGRFRLEAAERLPSTGTFDLVLVTVKSFDLPGASVALGRSLAATPTALLGNGLGIERTALHGLQEGGWDRPERFVVRAVHTVPATLLGPGRVRASGSGEVLVPAPESAGPAERTVRLLLDLFGRVGIPVRATPNFERELWRKAIVNAAINPLTALHGVVNGRLAEPPLQAEAGQLLAEAVQVAQAAGMAISPEEATADLARVVRATAENRSSMLQDLERGRPTEIDAISGEILRRGEAFGLRLPATAGVVERLKRRLGPAPAGKPS
jgi:2-dehydropantoate 2-reductase